MGTQALQNTYLAKLYGHTCKKSLGPTLMTTEHVEDRYLFTKGFKIVRLTSISGDSLTGREVPLVRGLFLGAGLDLNDVWCFERANPDEELWPQVTLSRSDVLGHCVLCDEIFSVLTYGMLRC